MTSIMIIMPDTTRKPNMTMIEIVISCTLFLPLIVAMVAVSAEYILEICDILREQPDGDF